MFSCKSFGSVSAVCFLVQVFFLIYLIYRPTFVLYGADCHAHEREQQEHLDMFILTSVLPDAEYRGFLAQNLPRLAGQQSRWRITWVILIDKFERNRSFLKEIVSWLRSEPAVNSVIELATFSSIQSEGLAWWTKVRHQQHKVNVLITQGELLPARRVSSNVKKSMEFYPDLVHETFKGVWFYHLDGDNATPCRFFNFTEELVTSHKNSEMFLFGQLRKNNVRLSPWRPQRRWIDTSQLLVHSRFLHENNLSWGFSDYPDGDFISNAFEAAKKRSDKLVITGSIAAFHNRLRWNKPLNACSERVTYLITREHRGGHLNEFFED